MLGKIFNFGSSKRPLVGEQNTGRDAYMRPFGVATVNASGWGGVANFRSLSPFNIATFNPQKVTVVSITGDGNDTNTNPLTIPLNTPQPTLQMGSQF